MFFRVQSVTTALFILALLRILLSISKFPDQQSVIRSFSETQHCFKLLGSDRHYLIAFNGVVNCSWDYGENRLCCNVADHATRLGLGGLGLYLDVAPVTLPPVPFVSIDSYATCTPKLQLPNPQSFYALYDCPSAFEQPGISVIRHHHPGGLTPLDIEWAFKTKSPSETSLNAPIHIQIIDNELFMRVPSYIGIGAIKPHLKRVMAGFISSFQELLRIVQVPNVEFVFRTWACIHHEHAHLLHEDRFPGFAFATKECGRDELGFMPPQLDSKLLFIRPYFNERSRSYPIGFHGRNMGLYDLLNGTLYDMYSWEKKKPLIFFRGACSAYERALWGRYLDEEAPNEISEMFDFGLSDVDIYPCQSQLNPPYTRQVKTTHFLEEVKFRYLLALEGAGPIDRLPRMMATGSLVIAIGPVFDKRSGEWWYENFKPGVHYIQLHSLGFMDEQGEFPTRASDLPRLIQKLKSDDAWARGIADAGYRRVQEVLSVRKTQCLMLRFFDQYRSLLNYTPTAHPDSNRFLSNEFQQCAPKTRCVDGSCVPFKSHFFRRKYAIFEHRIPIERSHFVDI